MHPDDAGLCLQVTESRTTPGTLNKSWVFRFVMGGRERQMGLGSLKTFTLADAREAARQCRRKVDAGQDPIAARDARKEAKQQAAATESRTFGSALLLPIWRPKKPAGATPCTENEPDNLGILCTSQNAIALAKNRIGDRCRLVKSVNDPAPSIVKTRKSFAPVLIPRYGICTQDSRCSGSTERYGRSPASNQCPHSNIRSHLMISGQVAVLSCGPVAAVIRHACQRMS
jgi:hypothetical protein